MLARARRKAPKLRFECADALSLPYASDSFDAATVGFGARNFADLERGIDEMARVVRPGGHVVILEITQPDARAAGRLLPPVVRPPRARASAVSPASPRPTATFPLERARASPAPASSRA